MITFGLGAKAVSEKLADVTGFGTTFDAGLMFRRGIVGLGIAAQNMFGQMKYSGAAYRFPHQLWRRARSHARGERIEPGDRRELPERLLQRRARGRGMAMEADDGAPRRLPLRERCERTIRSPDRRSEWARG